MVFRNLGRWQQRKEIWQGEAVEGGMGVGEVIVGVEVTVAGEEGTVGEGVNTGEEERTGVVRGVEVGAHMEEWDLLHQDLEVGVGVEVLYHMKTMVMVCTGDTEMIWVE